MSLSGNGNHNKEVNSKAAENVDRPDVAQAQDEATDALQAQSPFNVAAKAGKAAETAKPTEASEAQRAKEIADIQEALAKSAAAFAEIGKSVQNMVESLKQVPGFQRDHAWMEVQYPGLAQLIKPGDQNPNDIQLMMDRFRNATNSGDSLQA